MKFPFVRVGIFLVLVIFSERCVLLMALVLKPPIQLLYLKGYVWESREFASICAGITGTDASWWERDPHCGELVTRRIHALAVSSAVLLWSFLLLFLVLRLMNDEFGASGRGNHGASSAENLSPTSPKWSERPSAPPHESTRAEAAQEIRHRSTGRG